MSDVRKTAAQLDREIAEALASKGVSSLSDLEGQLSAEIRAIPMGPARVGPRAEWLNLAWRVARVAQGHERAQRGSSHKQAALIAARIAHGEDVPIDELRRVVLPPSQREFLRKRSRDG